MFNSIVVLTGAGLSKESGLDTFRDADGIWSKVRISDVATPKAFARDPGRVHAFYNARRAGCRAAGPNAAHLALADLEARHAGTVLIVTQNIDGLHEAAGSRNLIHMHGAIDQQLCARCGDRRQVLGDLSVETVCAACDQAGGVRPDVVWFGEMPYEMERILDALADADLFVSIGTSGNVYPAAGFVSEARRAGAHTVELNLEPSEGARLFAEAIHGPATQVVPAFVARLLGSGGG